MRILVITYLPWRDDISVGNTLTNIFSGLDKEIEFANIYFRGSLPSNKIASKYFCIPEKELAKNILSRKSPGHEVNYDRSQEKQESFSTAYNKARQLRWDILLLVQDLIGILGNWKSDKLDQFIEDFNPDLVFGPLGRMPVSNQLMRYIHTKYKKPVVSYAWDDHYSLKKQSFSPFFWLKTFIERKYIRQCARKCELIYTITKEMQIEYSQYFGKECKVLYKGYDFSDVRPKKSSSTYPKKIIYMGNLGSGRWQVLSKFTEALADINKEKHFANLDIYTLTPLSSKIKAKLECHKHSKLKTPVPSADILKTMRSADILLHIEPTNRKEKLFFRLSFSTKLVDYFFAARCILAIGGHTAAMNYLRNNNSGIVETNLNNIKSTLQHLLKNPQKIDSMGIKALQCGIENHQESKIKEMLLTDFKNIISKNAGQ